MNGVPPTIELEATAIRFFSPGDERAFFDWLKKLPFVVRYEGRGQVLYILIDAPAVDEEGLREMLALFRRYEVDLKQLVAFSRDEFADWFCDEKAYWHKNVFGGEV